MSVGPDSPVDAGLWEASDTVAVYVSWHHISRVVAAAIRQSILGVHTYPSGMTSTTLTRNASPQGSVSLMARFWVIGLFLAYGVLNVGAWWGSQPVTTWDSPRYTSGDIFLFLNPGITPTILFSAFEDPRYGTFIHTVLYTVAWSSLASALLVSLRATWIRWPLAILTLIVSFTSPLWTWNLVVGSEGLTVSAMVLWLSTFVWLASSNRTITLVMSTVAACGLLITRPQTLIFVIPIQVVASIWWIRRTSRTPRSMMRTLVWLAILLTGATGWATYRAALLANDDVYAFRYALHNLVEKTPSFRQYVLNEAPPCDAIPAALNGPQPWTDVIAFDNTLINVCPETYLWFKSDAVGAPSWIAYDPLAALGNFRDIMWVIALPRGAEVSMLPRSLDQALLPVHHVWLITAIALAIGLILGRLGRIKFRVTPLGVLGVVAIVGSIALYLFAVWAADGYDVIRHMVPITPLIPVVALTMPTGLAGKETTNRRPCR